MTERSPVDVLIVDDNADNRKALEVLLADLVDHVVSVPSGKEGLRSLLNRDFAAILLDVNMPIMDGFETAVLIRQRQRSESTPILFVTASSDEAHMARGYSLGAVDYILTPVVPEILRAKVAVFVELFRKTEEVKRQAASLRHRAAQLHALTEASIAINQAPSIEAMLTIVAARAREIVGAHLAVASADVAPHRVHKVFSASPECESVYERHRGKGTSVGALVQHVVAPAHAADGSSPADPALLLEGSVTAPLTGRDGRSLGCVELSGKYRGEFSEEDETVLAQIAQIVSIAIENILYAEERETNRLKDEFLATVSHELRTPLSAMMSWVRILRDGRIDEAAKARGLEVIERNAKAQAQLIDDLLDVSRIATGKLRLDIAPVDLDAVLSGAIDSARPAAELGQITLCSTLQPIDVPVEGDAKRLQQVVSNLLGNAIKFTPKGGRIDVSLRVVDGEIEIAVRDTGSGISPAFLPYIFDRFRQADASSTRLHGGIGLGLTIVRTLVDLHGGKVYAESEGEGRGATFIVRLPTQQPTDDLRWMPLQRPSSASLEGRFPGMTDGDDRPLTGLRVLLVEDDADGREALAVALRSAGVEVATVASSGDALHAIGESPPDVLVSDIGLPIEDGYVLIRKVRALEATRGGVIPAIALTAYTGAQDRARALAAGYQAHVAKPVDPAHLLAVLANFHPFESSPTRA